MRLKAHSHRGVFVWETIYKVYSFFSLYTYVVYVDNMAIFRGIIINYISRSLNCRIFVSFSLLFQPPSLALTLYNSSSLYVFVVVV